MCHAALSPSGYFDTCLYDLCELGLDGEALCNSLQAYADACQALGVKLPAWRNATFCRKSEAGKHFPGLASHRGKEHPLSTRSPSWSFPCGRHHVGAWWERGDDASFQNMR